MQFIWWYSQLNLILSIWMMSPFLYLSLSVWALSIKKNICTAFDRSNWQTQFLYCFWIRSVRFFFVARHFECSSTLFNEMHLSILVHILRRCWQPAYIQWHSHHDEFANCFIAARLCRKFQFMQKSYYLANWTGKSSCECQMLAHVFFFFKMLKYSKYWIGECVRVPVFYCPKN